MDAVVDLFPTALSLLRHDVGNVSPRAELSDEDYVQAALASFLGRGVSPGQFRQRPTLDPARALSVQERSSLEAIGMLPDERTAADAEAARRASLNVFFEVFRSALSTADAARLLKKDPSRIRQRIRERSLLALTAGGEARLPALQFHENAELPSLGPVLRALPKDLDVLEALAWLATPTPDLADAEDRPASPRDHLLRTGDASAVVALAEGLARGQAG